MQISWLHLSVFLFIIIKVTVASPIVPDSDDLLENLYLERNASKIADIYTKQKCNCDVGCTEKAKTILSAV